MKALLIAGSLVLLGAAPVLAQPTTVPPTAPTVPQAGAPVAQPGSPGVANSGPASAGTVSPSGTGADTITNNPAQTGNSSQPSRANPSTGGGGASK